MVENPRFAFSISHAPWKSNRRAWVLRIRAELQRQIAQAETDDTVDVVVDHRRQGVWPTVRRSYVVALSRNPTHVLQMSDDWLVPRGFVGALHEIVRLLPDTPILLHCGWQAIDKAHAAGKHWVSMPNGFQGGSHLIDAETARAYLTWEAAFCRPEYKHDDSRLGLYLISRGKVTYCTVPCLLYHLAPSDSAVEPRSNGAAGRTTRVFSEDVSGIDWARDVNDPMHASHASWVRRNIRQCIYRGREDDAGLGSWEAWARTKSSQATEGS